MKSFAKNILGAVVFAVLPFVMHAHAQEDANNAHEAHHSDAEAVAEMSEGEVRKVNKDTQKITLRHGELKNLGMPPMTMVFRVSDPAYLDKVKVGDKVRFVAEKVDGLFTVTRIDVQE